MKKTIATACVLVMMSIGVCAGQSAPQTPAVQKKPTAEKTDVASKKKASAKKNGKAVEAVQQLPAQIMPPLPATLMNSAPVKPNVTMESGLLTIDAPNSTLSDVLSGVHRATGANIEGASPTERVAVKLGPGNPEQVIAALLRGTPYDYVILGSLGKPDVVTRVLLTQQPSGGAQPAQEQSGRAMGHPPQEPAFQPPTDDSLQEHSSPEDATPDATPPAAENEGERMQQDPQPPADANAPKTPEQLFKELQQLQQQNQPK
jgi:hypothetical protein